MLANVGGLVLAGDPELGGDARDKPVVCKDLNTGQDLHSYIEKGTAKWVWCDPRTGEIVDRER